VAGNAVSAGGVAERIGLRLIVRRILRFCVALLGLVQVPVGAQSSGAPPLDAPTYDRGTVTNGTYTNECLGFSLPIPHGWEIHRFGAVPEGKALHLPSGQLMLFTITQRREGQGENTIGMTASPANDFTSVRDSVTRGVQGQVKLDPVHRQLLRDTEIVEYGGRHFFRSDFKQQFKDGSVKYLGAVYTRFRGYDIGESLVAGSQDELDAAVDLLKQISFRDGQADPRCTVGEPDPRAPVGGVISSTPTKPGPNTVVRVSQKVAQALLIKRVEPQYPEAALREHALGDAVLTARIDKNGDVESVNVVSGDPMLAPAAAEAVKQWKYKPYLLAGEPAKIETQITVTFSSPQK
jgi:TonB family protein